MNINSMNKETNMNFTKIYFLVFSSIVLTVPYSSAKTKPISSGLNCQSWRLSVETRNFIDSKLVPKECAAYVRVYMQGTQYRRDCDMVADIAIQYAKTVKVGGDGKDIWVLDIDETALSNLPFYSRPEIAFGAKPYNWTTLGMWMKTGRAPAIPSVLRLYKELIAMRYKIVFMTGQPEIYKVAKISNLKNVGYTTWENIIFKSASDRGTPTKIFKSKKRKELEAEGYRIIGNVGDQWGDIMGESTGKRTFKMPNPMYTVG